MKKITRINTSILAMTIVLTLSACGEQPEETTVPTTETTAEVTAEVTESESAEEETTGEPENKITWKIEDGTLTIGGSGKMIKQSDVGMKYPWSDPIKAPEVEKIVIEDGVENIGDSAFVAFKSCTSVTIPDSVVSIGKFAFSSCTALTSVEIPQSVTSIGEDAFAHCKALTTVKLNAKADFTYNIFQNCTSITDVTVGDHYVYEEGILYSKDMTVIIACLDQSITTADIPGGVTYIGDYAFRNHKNLATVIIPDTVTEIGSFAFANCYKLTSATIPSSVTAINKSAFEYDVKLTATIDNSKENVTLGEYAFAQNATVIYTK